MPDPFEFNSASPRLGLPYLFAGQAQKEAWINEAHARIDTLLHGVVEGDRADPPSSPVDGEAWVVAPEASGDWAGKETMIAARHGGNWLFFAGTDGMRVFDRSTGQERLFFSGSWQIPTIPSEPSGGATVDVEARAALAELFSALRVSGIFAGV